MLIGIPKEIKESEHRVGMTPSGVQSLIENGHTIICVEHNSDVIKCADWLIDLGPEGGEKGGDLLFQGTPEDLIKNNTSYTAHFLKEKLLSSIQK